MTMDVQEAVNLMKGLVKKSMSRMIEDENKEMDATFDKCFKRLAWYELKRE